MSDRLREALTTWDEGLAGLGDPDVPPEQETIVAAAHLVLNGTPIRWCEEHGKEYPHDRGPSGSGKPCRLVEKLLVDPAALGGEEE